MNTVLRLSDTRGSRRGMAMEREIREFISWIHRTNGTSYNTEVSYQRDLKKMAAYFEALGLREPALITGTDLEDYREYMEKEGLASSTISRNVASIRAFFHFLTNEGKTTSDPSLGLRAPKVERKAPSVLSVEEVEMLLKQPSPDTTKGMRDKAMLEVLYATGMKVSEVIHLELDDVNLEYAYISCRESGHERVLPVSPECCQALTAYLGKARPKLVKDPAVKVLFTNCSGKPMSRQGFWKVLKSYASMAGIEGDIAPHTLRHSFAVHMLRNGADYKSLQDMLGNNCLSASQIYMDMERPKLREVYMKSHRRKVG